MIPVQNYQSFRCTPFGTSLKKSILWHSQNSNNELSCDCLEITFSNGAISLTSLKDIYLKEKIAASLMGSGQTVLFSQETTSAVVLLPT